MSIEELNTLKFNANDLIKSKENLEVEEFKDRSDILFKHMNLIAMNNKIDLKIR